MNRLSDNKKFNSCIAKVNHYLHLAKKDKTNAYITVTEEIALEKAAVLDRKNDIPKSSAGNCMIMAVKDNILLKGYPTTAGSKILQNFIAPYNATVVDLLNDANIVITGKTNMDEFGMGSTGRLSAFGAVINPIKSELITGGSSSGSAAAVAAGLVDIALGSDTGGSVRQPAAFTGLVGFKPSYGRISRYGLIAFASSFDQIGLIARTVSDIQKIFPGLDVYDAKDATSLPDSLRKKSEHREINKGNLRIAVLHEKFLENVHYDIWERFQLVRSKLSAAKIKIVEISPELLSYVTSTYGILANAEAASNLRRYDGIRFGLQNRGNSFEDIYTHTRHDGFGDEVIRRIVMGTRILSGNYRNQYLAKASKMRIKIKKQFRQLFTEVDFLLTPVSASLPVLTHHTPLEMYKGDYFTVTANLTGDCAVSVPAGYNKDGIPLAVQLSGKMNDDYRLLQVAEIFEKLLTEK